MRDGVAGNLGKLLALVTTFALIAGPLPYIAIASPANAKDPIQIHFVTESYPPFSFRDGVDLRGASVDQIKLIMKDTGIAYTMEIMPWARALSLATTQDSTCVFSTVHNAERDPKFKWIEPISKSRTLLISKEGSLAAPKTLEQAKAYIVGTQRDDFTHNILETNGFPRIDLAPDFSLTMKKLTSGRIDLMPISEIYYDKLRREGAPIKSVLLLAEDIYAIACNKTVPDTTITRLQKSLDTLIASGSQEKIYEQYGLLAK